MLNLPGGDINQVTLGPGRLYLGPAGSTPSQEVGYVQGDTTITFERKRTDVRQGSPQIIVDAFANEENVMIEFPAIQYNLDAVLRIIGDGATSASGADTILKFGGSPGFSKFAARFVHILPSGGTLIVDIWKAIGEGTIPVKVSPTELHEVPLKLNAIYPGTTDWGGATLSNGQQLVKITRTAA